MDVLLAEAVLVAVLHEALGGVDHEDALAGVRAFLVEHDDAGGDAGAVEEVRRQADDALDVATLDEVAADVGLGIAAKQHAVREDARAFAGALERAEDVQQVGVVALLAGRDAVVLEALPGVVLGIEAGAPALVAEGRIGDDVVEGLERVAVEEERAGEGVALLDLRRGVVVQDHVHAGEAGGGVVLLLPVEGDLHVLRRGGPRRRSSGAASPSRRWGHRRWCRCWSWRGGCRESAR